MNQLTLLFLLCAASVFSQNRDTLVFVEYECRDLLSVTDICQDCQISIEPVPNSGQFIVDLSYPTNINMRVEVFNSAGIEVYEKNLNVNRTFRLPVSLDVPSGLYFLVVTTHDNTYLAYQFTIQK